jgi:hypothetical protein
MLSASANQLPPGMGRDVAATSRNQALHPWDTPLMGLSANRLWHLEDTSPVSERSPYGTIAW